MKTKPSSETQNETQVPALPAGELSPLKEAQQTDAVLQPVVTAADLKEVKDRLKDGWNEVVLLTPGEPLPACRPGDFLLVKGVAPLSYLIRLGERLHHSKAASQWSHAAVIVGNGTIAEALAKDICYSPASKYDNRWRALCRVVGSSENRASAMRYVEHCIGQDYGFLDFVSVALSQLFGFRFVITTSTSQICSEFVAHTLERLGYIFPKSPELTAPADLYQLAEEGKSAQ